MAINKVDLTVSQLISDLNEGFTWLKKDDLGYGSIEVKYSANPQQIAAIRKHPALKDAETNITIFNIIDDTKNDPTRRISGGDQSAPNITSNTQVPTQTIESESKRTDDKLQQRTMDMASNLSSVGEEAADIFANL